ncbi:acyltransferase family protein [Beijerinckia indica]|uniref:Acyltransferase 3 n=1 Tax=Beijerinckia indica subsp. indica (strain ATCC 9039 / DSM 1715 / NCIMB 8712) TaxID=395963 RepID=B2IG32_BEII9|nr:acyltransferase [Beijerinckia indica]ACB95769.1 acyltransferase 3 [Beijerinckia indica subsp. indica ATCC 9039]
MATIPNAEKPFLFTLRWISSLIVMFGHAYSMVFHPYEYAGWHESLGGFLQYIAQFRHSAVIIFFVLSGYLVGGGVLRRLDAFDFSHYFFQRFARIYVVLVPALLLTACLDGIVYLIDPTTPIYADTQLTETLGIDGSVFTRYDPRSIFASLVSLESIVGDPIGSNRALWSLGYEWLYYFLFPATVFLAAFIAARLKLSRRWVAEIGVVVVACIFLALGQRFLAATWVIWTSGAIVSRWRAETSLQRWLARFGGVIAFLAFLASPIYSHRVTDPILGLGFAAFLTLPNVLRLSFNPAFDRGMANWSYSLYVIHEPVLLFVLFLFGQQALFDVAGLPLSWLGGGIFLAASGSALAVALLFGRLFEDRTDAFRLWLMRRLTTTETVPAASR